MFRILSLFMLIAILSACASYMDVKPVGHPDDMEYWDDFRTAYHPLTPNQFRFFTFHHIDEYRKAPDSVKQESIQKWRNAFPEEPWPPEHPPETLPSAHPAATATSLNVIQFLKENIYSSAIWDFLK